MATNNCVPVEFVILSEDGFFFAGVDTVPGLDVDSFSRSSLPPLGYCVRSNDNKIVILNTEGCFEARNLSLEQQRRNDSRFDVQFYNVSDLNDKGERGKPVILYTRKDGNLWLVSCNESGEIRPEKMDQLPDDIPEDKHKAVFYRKQITSSKYHLQSSLDSSKFLGFKSLDTNGSPVLKLVLLPGIDDVDSNYEVSMSRIK